MGFEDFASIKVSSPCGGLTTCNDSSWWSLMVLGGGGGGLGLCLRVLGREIEREKHVSLLWLSKLSSLWAIALSALVSLSKVFKGVISQIPTSKLCRLG